MKQVDVDELPESVEVLTMTLRRTAPSAASLVVEWANARVPISMEPR